MRIHGADAHHAPKQTLMLRVIAGELGVIVFELLCLIFRHR